MYHLHVGVKTVVLLSLRVFSLKRSTVGAFGAPVSVKPKNITGGKVS